MWPNIPNEPIKATNVQLQNILKKERARSSIPSVEQSTTPEDALQKGTKRVNGIFDGGCGCVFVNHFNNYIQQEGGETMHKENIQQKRGYFARFKVENFYLVRRVAK